MKYHSLFLSFFLLFSPLVNAQDITLPTDADKKITYTDVVEMKETKADVIQAKAVAFLKTEKNISDIKEDGNTVTANGFDDFIGGAKKQKMKMSYSLKMEFKDGRYKYTITKVEYTPYPDASNPTQMTFAGEKWYDEYRLLVGKGKEKSAQAKSYYQIFMTTDRDITAFIDKMKAGMVADINGTDDW